MPEGWLSCARCWGSLRRKRRKAEAARLRPWPLFFKFGSLVYILPLEGEAMKTVAEYRQNAADCRALAKKMQREEDRETLEHMAQTWDKLARSREGRLLAGVEPDDVS